MSGVWTDVPRTPVAWGDWRLGDLADAMQTVSRALGPGTKVDQAGIFIPAGLESMVTVQLIMPGSEELEALRKVAASAGDLLTEIGPHSSDEVFHAVVDDVVVCAWPRA